MEEYEKFDKETRALTYKMLMEKFNEKYAGLNKNQKTLLKEYVYNISNSPKLKRFINEEINNVRAEIKELSKKTDKVKNRYDVNNLCKEQHMILKSYL